MPHHTDPGQRADGGEDRRWVDRGGVNARRITCSRVPRRRCLTTGGGEGRRGRLSAIMFATSSPRPSSPALPPAACCCSAACCGAAAAAAQPCWPACCRLKSATCPVTRPAASQACELGWKAKACTSAGACLSLSWSALYGFFCVAHWPGPSEHVASSGSGGSLSSGGAYGTSSSSMASFFTPVCKRHCTMCPLAAPRRPR